MKKLNTLLTLISILVFSIPNQSYSQFRVSKLFSDGMVLQRDVSVPVWGWAEKGEKISVNFNNKVYSAQPDASGKWMVKLPAMSAGGPYQMTISGKKNKIDISDILMGDVWICSGQSNMEWLVMNSNNAEEEISNATDTKIRHFKVPLTFAEKAESELAGGDWEVTSPETVGNFSAVGYFFAVELRKNVDVPIGLINTSWGGSRLEPWMSAESLGIEDPENAFAEIKAKAEIESKKKLAEFRKKFGEISDVDPGYVDGIALWADPQLDETSWQTVPLPGLWEIGGYEGLDGIGWYRKEINLSEEEAKSGIKLGLGKIDDSDITWVNGVQVGSLIQQYSTPREYEVKPEVLKAGRNIIAVRVEDTGGGGGIYGEPELMYLKTSSGTLTLTGEWKFRIGAFAGTAPSFSPNQIATLLYNKMIYPLLDFPIKGALWYQGESNAGSREDAMKYRELFAKMIGDWRAKWKVGDFPFLFVQLANFMEADEQPTESFWALLRESQSATLEVSNTGQAVIIDIGEADDIHPRNKQDVGLRLALAARHIAYGEDLVYSGPVFKSQKVDGTKIILEFDHIGSGLWVKDKYGYARGFAIAGSDGKFMWAQARQEGKNILVWNDRIKQPVYVRYAWGNNPDDANLYNMDGLPATPFRTDK